MRQVDENKTTKVLEVLIPLTGIRTVFNKLELFLHYFGFLNNISQIARAGIFFFFNLFGCTGS